jgi:hypothetical protein
MSSQGVLPVCSDPAIRHGDCHEEIPYDDITAVVFPFAVNSESMIGEKECAPSAFAGDLATSESYPPGEDEDQEVATIQTFRERALGVLGSISEEQKLSFDSYQDLYEQSDGSENSPSKSA